MNKMLNPLDPRVLKRLPMLAGVRSLRTKRQIDRAYEAIAKAGRLRLRDYVQLAWPIIEPVRVYKHSWHIDAICEHLEAVEESHIIRLAIAMPPGCMKSLLCGVCFPTHIWGPGGRPSARFLGFSNDMKLSSRDAVKSRRLINSDWYQQLWGDRFSLVDDQNQKTRYENDQTGFRIADYVGGGTGERGDVVTIDDPHEVSDAVTFSTDLRQLERASFWLHETLPSRVNDPETSGIVCVHHRIHQKDMIGDIMKSDLGYEYLRLPMEYEPKLCSYTKVKRGNEPPVEVRRTPDMTCMTSLEQARDWGLEAVWHSTAPQMLYKADPRTKQGELLFEGRFPRDVVDREKKVMRTFAVNGQFQQNPQPREGTMIKRAWFNIVGAAPADCYWARHWDLAATKDGSGAYTAGVLMGRSRSSGQFYIGDVQRDRLEGDAVRKLIRQTAAVDFMKLGKPNYMISLPQDPGQAGKVQAKDFVIDLAGYSVHTFIESGDKETRAQPFADQAEAGNVFLVAGPWNEAYLDEAVVFPGGDYKDQIDGSSGAFSTLIMHPKRNVVVSSVKGHS